MSSKHKLLEHQKIEHKYKCDQCSRSYILNPDLLHHILKYHDKNEDKYKAQKNMDHPWKCRFCHLKFTFSNGLEDHENAEHSFKCNQCLKGFHRKGSYERHLNSNHVHPCDFCDLVFVNSYELETHVEDLHNKVGQIQKKHLDTKGVITTQKNAEKRRGLNQIQETAEQEGKVGQQQCFENLTQL